jgi:hypothetical protein
MLLSKYGAKKTAYCVDKPLELMNDYGSLYPANSSQLYTKLIKGAYMPNRNERLFREPKKERTRTQQAL